MKLRELPSSIDWRALRAGIPAACVGLLGVIVLASLMGQATGGLPSRPRFQAVHIGPQTGGALTAGDSRGKLFVATGATLGFDMLSTAPRIRWVDTNATATEQVWDCLADGDAFRCRTRTDVDGAGVEWLQVNRTGTAISSYTLANNVDVFARGVMVHRVKTADTARSSTTTLANDPHMVYAIPVAGTYRFRAYLQFDGTTTGTQGIAWNVNYSGTFTSPASHWMSYIHCSGAMATGGDVVEAAVTTAGRNCATLTTTDSDNALEIVGTLVATGAGDLGIAWAQLVSNANATNVRDGSSLEVTQIL